MEKQLVWDEIVNGVKGNDSQCESNLSQEEYAQNEKIKKIEAYIQKVEDEFAKDEDIKLLVTHIEKGIKTTKGHYGKYMQLLSKFSKEKAFCIGMARGLKRLGANAYGVDWALKLTIGG